MSTHRIARRIGTVLTAGALAVMGTIGIGAGTAAAAPAGTCHPFPDVTASNIHCDNIAWLADHGITKPANGQFHPDSPVTRWQMAAFLYRLSYPPTAQNRALHRADEPPGGYLHWAVYYGRMAATPGGRPAVGTSTDGVNLQPNKIVTRASMATILHATSSGYAWTVGCNLPPYNDVPRDGSHCQDIAWAKATGITYGVSGGRFAPAAPVTRAQMATFLHRLSAYGLEHNRIRVEAGNEPITVMVAQGSQRDSFSLGAGDAVTVRPDPNDGAVTITRRGAEPVVLHASSHGRLLPDVPLPADSGWTVGVAGGSHATTVGLTATGVGR